LLLGIAAGLGSALIGAGWQVMTRKATTTTSLGPDVLVVLRYMIPALVLLPVWLRIGLLPRGVPRGALAAMVIGGGLPFGLLAIGGTRFAPAAHMGVLIAGAAPLMTAAGAWLIFRERVPRERALGLALLAIGVALLGSRQWGGAAGTTWIGDLLFLAGAVVWVGFTLGFRRTGLTPPQAVALVNAWSSLFLLPWLFWHAGAVLLAAPVGVVVTQALWQGVFAGVGAVVLYAVCIRELGPAPATALGACVPVLSAVGAWWWLGEHLAPMEWAAVAFAAAGVVLASGVLRRH
jgi:drug/metabolite transporter (DMT)-like permease